MKKTILFIAVAISMTSLKAQVSTFDDLTLPKVDTFWNGSDLSGEFTSGGAQFHNDFQSWFSNDIGYSNMTDNTTEGSTNQYSAYTGVGYNGSDNYAVVNAYDYAKITLQGNVGGVYITNATYGALSMLNGDGFAKKFGGATGSDPDWLLLKTEGFLQGNSTGVVDFYLADYRFSDNSKDYIIEDWTWLDLTNLGTVDSLKFTMSSSDSNNWGMLTPSYFCMDDFTIDQPTGIESIYASSGLSFYPNPASDQLFVDVEGEVELSILNTSGEVLKNETVLDNGSIDISSLNSGIYIVRMKSDGIVYTDKLIKQ